MPRDTLVIQELGAEGSQYDAAVAFTDFVDANEMDFDNVGGNVLIWIENSGAGSQTATFKTVADPFGRSGDMDVAVVNGKTAVVGPFNPMVWNQSDGKVHIDSGDEDSFAFAAVRFTPR